MELDAKPALELARPHGFLLWREKKKAIARPVGDELPVGQALTVTTDGEAFGDVTLGTPATVPVLEFDGAEWFTHHRVKVKERNSWWPRQTQFLVYPVVGFKALKKTQWLKGVPASYAPATGDRRCPDCLEYEDGFCRMHDQVVEDDHVCEDWDGLEDWRGGGTAQKALESEPVTSDMAIIEDWRGGGPELERQSFVMNHWGDPALGAKGYNGAMVALFLPTADAQAMAMDLGEGSLPPDELHLTLLFLGDSRELDNREMAETVVGKLASELSPIQGRVQGFGMFLGNEEGDVLYASFDAKELPALRQELVQRLAAVGFEPPGEHGFTPHITLAYLPEGTKAPVDDIETRPVTFDKLTLAWGEERTEFPLGKAGKKEAETMPYEKRQQGDQWCVFKEGESEPMKCYDAEGDADDYLTALRINVEAEESESKAADDPPDVMAEDPEARAQALLRQAIKEALAESEAEKQALADELAALKAELDAVKQKAPEKTVDGEGYPAGAFLVVEDPEKPSTWHLRVKNADGDLDHRLMGAAWAALTVGYRGNKYEGPDKQEAMRKLKRLYEAEGMDTPGEKAAEDPEDTTKARGEGQGQGNEPEGDGGTDTCVCPKCGAKTEHERGTPCNETDCPECGATMTAEGSQVTGAEEKAEGDTDSDTTTKAGARLKRTMMDRIKDALDTLKEVLGWAEYEDQEPEPEMATAPFFKFEHPAGMTVKEIDGEPWLVTYTTNAFKDRQKEMFSTSCLEQYITEAEQKGDRGTYDFWHIPGSDFAEVKLQMMAGRFLVEAGPFLNTEVGQRAQKFFTEHPDGHPTLAPEGWGCSPEFRYLPEQRKSGTYDWIWIVRRAVLPRAAAANVWTHGNVEVVTMATKQQRDAFAAVVGDEVADQIITDGEERTKQLEEAGVAHKGESETAADAAAEDVAQEAPAEEAPEPEEKQAQAPEINLKDLAEQVASLFEVQLEPLAEVAEAVKALNSRMEALEEQKAMEREVEMPRFTLSLQKNRASQAKETQVDEDDPLLKMKPQEAKPNKDNTSGAAHFFGGS